MKNPHKLTKSSPASCQLATSCAILIHWRASQLPVIRMRFCAPQKYCTKLSLGLRNRPVFVFFFKTHLHYCLIIFIQFLGSFISGREAEEAINNCWANTGSSLLARPQTIQKRRRGSAALIKWNKVRWRVVAEEWLCGLYLVPYTYFINVFTCQGQLEPSQVYETKTAKKPFVLSRLHPN